MHVDDKASMILSTYTFFHQNQRSWGNLLPYQCLCCYCTRPWKSVAHSLTDEAQFTCKTCRCNITYTRPKLSKIILFTNGYQGISSVSGKLSKKGGRAGSGWLMLVAIKPAHQPSLDHVAADHWSTFGLLFVCYLHISLSVYCSSSNCLSWVVFW